MAQKTKKKLIRVWAIVSALVLILLTVATVLTQFVMQDVLASLLGRDVAVYAEGVTPLYATEYTNKDEVYQAANKLNERVCEEGFVLLKNEGNALPLASGSRITVFGKNSVNLAYGGSGSSGGDKSTAIDLYTSLQNAGFAVNPAMKPFYEDDKRSGARRSENSTNLDDGNTVFYSIGETPQRLYTKEITDTYKDYNDAALVVLTRIGGEGFDLQIVAKVLPHRAVLEIHRVGINRAPGRIHFAIQDASQRIHAGCTGEAHPDSCVDFVLIGIIIRMRQKCQFHRRAAVNQHNNLLKSSLADRCQQVRFVLIKLQVVVAVLPRPFHILH